MSALDIVGAQSETLVPASFQRDIIANMADALLRTPSPPCLLRAPTGSGKTFMLTGILDKVTAATPTLWLWFVPFVNLVQQTEDALLGNAANLTPVMLARGRNQLPVSGMVMLSTAQAVARAKDRKAGYAADGDDDRKTLEEFVMLARSQQLRIGLVVDEAHIGLDSATEFGQFAHWLAPDYLLMASATPKDVRLDEFLAKSGKGAREAFPVGRAEVVEARLNKRYIEAVVYDLRHTVSTITDLKRTVLRQAWLRHVWLKKQLADAGVELTPLLLVQVGNGDKTVEDAERDLIQLCKVPPGVIGKHSSDAPDPVLMAAIANDHTKEVLIFKQSAGTGFDAPRAFVLASTKPVNDPDFAMQFIGRVMRVAPAVRKAFPKPVAIPADFDTAYVYLADAEAQQGFQSAVNTSQAVKTQLEGQTERMVSRETASGAKVFTNRITAQMPVTYEAWAPDDAPSRGPVESSDEHRFGSQPGLFSPGQTSAGQIDPGTTLMGWDRVVAGQEAQHADTKKLNAQPTEAECLDRLQQHGLKAYRRVLTLRHAPAFLQREARPILDDMGRISDHVAASLPIDQHTQHNAVLAAYNLLAEREIHTELTEGVQHEERVLIITDRRALLREAEACLRRIPQVEDEDVRIIIGRLSQRLTAAVSQPPESVVTTAMDEKQITRLARDAACWVVRKCAQTLTESIQEMVSASAIIQDSEPLPDVMLYPLQAGLIASSKNLYGAFPPREDKVDIDLDELDIDAKTMLSNRDIEFVGGHWRAGTFDKKSALNLEELEFAKGLDRAEFVIWWHRNPDQKPWSVRLVRADHTHYFYPDFVVCLEHQAERPPMTRLIETKESTKDAARKARRIPKIYQKVLFVTKDQQQLRIVNDDGSLGDAFDWGDLAPVQRWMHETANA